MVEIFTLYLFYTDTTSSSPTEPSSPERLTSNEIGDTWVHLTWSRSTKPAAKIVGYHVYYETEDESDGKRDGRIVERTDDIISYNLTGLTPYTQYRIWAVAKSRRVEGRRSTPVQVRTDVSRPGTPAINNITCRGGSSVYVHWRRPLQLHGAVDFYLVQYRAEQRREFEELVIPTTAGRQEETVSVGGGWGAGDGEGVGNGRWGRGTGIETGTGTRNRDGDVRLRTGDMDMDMARRRGRGRGRGVDHLGTETETGSGMGQGMGDGRRQGWELEHERRKLWRRNVTGSIAHCKRLLGIRKDKK